MNSELLTFAKKLDTKNLNKALEIKQQLEDKHQAPPNFRVNVKNLWSKGFTHDNLQSYIYVQDQLADLDIAEKNLNRNVDSKAQQDIFVMTANEVKNNFIKRYGAKEWQPRDARLDA